MFARQLSIALFTLSLLACGGERSQDTGRNLSSGERDGGSDGALDDRDAAAPDVSDAPDAARDAAPDSELDAAIPDGSAPDAEVVGGFSVTVRRGAQLLANVPVWFHDAQGAVLSEHETNLQGRVTSDITPSMATVLAPIRRTPHLGLAGSDAITFTALSAGDQLVVDLPVSEPSGGEQLPAYRVSFGQVPDGSYCALLAGLAGCATAALNFEPESPQDLSWPSNCPSHAGNSLLFVAGAETGGVLGYAYAKGVPGLASGQQAVTLGAFAAPSSMTLSARNVPEFAQVEPDIGLWSEGVSFAPQRVASIPMQLPSGDTTRSLSYPLPTGFAETVDVQLRVSGPGQQQTSTYAARQLPSASMELDFANRQHGASSLELDAADPQRPTLRWQNEPGFSGADASITLLYAVLELGDDYADPLLAWLVVGPADITTQTLAAPGAGFPFTIQSDTVGAAITYVDGSTSDGYRGFLREPLRPLDLGDRFDDHPVLLRPSQVGTVRAVTTRLPENI